MQWLSTYQFGNETGIPKNETAAYAYVEDSPELLICEKKFVKRK